MHGKVISLKSERGFGFIAPAGERENVFFHARECRGVMFEDLVEGDAVAFDLAVQPDGRKRAVKVHLPSRADG